jgi:hypothetical protein
MRCGTTRTLERMSTAKRAAIAMALSTALVGSGAIILALIDVPALNGFFAFVGLPLVFLLMTAMHPGLPSPLLVAVCAAFVWFLLALALFFTLIGPMRSNGGHETRSS